MKPCAIAALCSLLLIAISFGPRAAVSDVPTFAVTTVAGNGRAGIVDGPAAAAEFLMPSGIAIRKPDGTIFISDEAAQRIRELTPAGTVVTLAGSGNPDAPGLAVGGGYADGPASQAKFNRPAGLAIGPDGGVYVADSLNGCVRKLLNATVTTVIGKCYGAGGPAARQAIDGDAQTARLINPRSLAFDSAGDLYIADIGAGLRRLDTDGILRTVHLKTTGENEFVSVAYGGGRDPVILATSPMSVVPFHPSTGREDPVNAEPSRPLGQPTSVASIDDRQFLFTDATSEAVRYLRLPAPPFVGTTYSKIIAGNPNDAADAGGYRDGPLAQAQFNAPLGIAIDKGVAYVADAGNRRIRKVVLPHFRVSETGLDPSYSRGSAYYEVALIGASYVFYDTLGDDSMCAAIERTLNASDRFAKPVRCHTVRIDAAPLPKIASYIKNILALQKMNAIIIYLSAWQSPVDAGIPSFYEMPPAKGVAIVRATVKELLKTLAATRTSLSIAWGYLGTDVSDAEDLIVQERPSALYPLQRSRLLPNGGAHEIISKYVAALRGLSVRQYDAYNDLLRYEKSRDALPLYQSEDLHYNTRGNAFLGQHIAAGLLAQGFGKHE